MFCHCSTLVHTFKSVFIYRRVNDLGLVMWKELQGKSLRCMVSLLAWIFSLFLKKWLWFKKYWLPKDGYWMINLPSFFLCFYSTFTHFICIFMSLRVFTPILVCSYFSIGKEGYPPPKHSDPDPPPPRRTVPLHLPSIWCITNWFTSKNGNSGPPWVFGPRW